jgi:glycosyltransferase involved in cell wall biosynthesis
MNILIDGQTLSRPDVRRGIGRVFIQLCEEMLPADRSKQWYFAVQSAEDLNELSEEVRRIAIPLVVPALSETSDPQVNSQIYSDQLGELCLGHEIDLYWNPNPVMLNVSFPLQLTGVRKVCTFYDLIPLQMTETYRDTWPPVLREDYDQRVEQIPGWADHIAFISQASRDDYALIDPRVSERSSVKSLGVDHATFWASIVPVRSTSSPYVLLVGGGDPRKNMDQAIVAFASTTNDHVALSKLRLQVVGTGDDQNRRRLMDVAKSHGVSDRVVLHKWVDDRHLAQLYRQSSCLFFPSLYEGFGLPIIEAMACGVPTVVSDRPEFRECAGSLAYFCDPKDIESMARALQDALTNETRNNADRASIVSHARQFDWAKSAAEYCDLFDELGTRNPGTPKSSARRKRRIAWVSPWPPAKTGVADYSAEIVGTLRATLDIDLYVETPESVEADSGLQIYALDQLRERHQDYDSVIYHLGNNSDHHAGIYRLAWDVPGIVVIHDYNIHPFLQHAYLGTENEWLYRDALIEVDQDAGLDHFESVRDGRCDPDIWNYPLSQAVARRSRGVIVHNAWAREALGGSKNVYTIPHFARTRPALSGSEVTATRASLGLRPDEFTIGIFGFINAHKRIPAVLEACARMRERGFPVHLLMVGASLDSQYPLEGFIREFGAENFCTQTGYVSEQQFWNYLDAVDVVTNLRFPTMGESSGSLFRAFGSGKPCLVTDLNQFAELPDSVCWKTDHGPDEVSQIVAYLEVLLGDSELRGQLGESARQFIANYASKEKVARLYESVIEKTQT